MIDHLLPKSQGGENDDENNKEVSCNRCNTLKGRQCLETDAKTPKDKTHRDELIGMAHALIKKNSEQYEERSDYNLLLKNRLLFLVFTIRNDKIRIISARDMTEPEIAMYLK